MMICREGRIILQASSGAAADFSYISEDGAFGSPEQQRQLRERLDYKPKLSYIDVST